MVSQPNPKDPKPKKSPKRKIIVIAVVLLLLIAGTAISMEITSQSTFCNTCHEMEQHYAAWEHSSHDEVACIDCHSEPTLGGYIEVKANGLRQVWVHMTDAPEPGTIRADQQKVNCINCHQDKPRTNVDQAAVDKDPHTQIHFDDLNMNCVTCHTGLTHTEGMNTMRPDRATCLNCHYDGSMQ